MAENNYAVSVAGANQEIRLPILEKNKCAGFWRETENGVSVPRVKPCFHTVVEGDLTEILRRTSLLGKDFDLEGIVVAIHDGAARDSGVFTLRLTPALTDDGKAAIAQALTDSGLPWATCLLENPEFRLVAFGREDMRIIRKVVRGLPGAYEAQLSFVPAVTRYINQSEYESIIADKGPGAMVVAETFAMGVPVIGRGQVPHADRRQAETSIRGA